MWKKTLGIAMILASLSVSAFASIPRDQIHIGGLKPGMTLQQVAAMYGMPKAVQSDSKAARGMYQIAGGLINGWLNEKGVFAQYTLSNRLAGGERIAASGNIQIGMTTSDVINRLGNPDNTQSFNNIILLVYNSVEEGIAGRGYPDVLILSFSNGRLSTISINRR